MHASFMLFPKDFHLTTLPEYQIPLFENGIFQMSGMHTITSGGIKLSVYIPFSFLTKKMVPASHATTSAPFFIQARTVLSL